MTYRRSVSAVLVSALVAVTNASAGGAAIGTFTQNLYGVSTFVEEGSNIHLRGAYSGLNRKRTYFSVVYGNGNCDPAQAFPVGPFTVGRGGTGTADVTAPNPTGVDLDKTGSISVRIGDTDAKGNSTDQDGDGKTGGTDVVAVAGQPAIGLVSCDYTPFTN